MERESTIRGLFSPDNIQFCIPNYQRAYSWEQDRQVRQFIEDLRDHPKSIEDARPYYLGHFLFENNTSESGKFWVIDGQQRLTTVVLFFRSLCCELLARKTRGEAELEEFNPDKLRHMYLVNEGQRKLKTVSYDDDFFRILLLNETTYETPATRSAARLVAATKKLREEMQKEEKTEELLRWLALVENAIITTYEINNKDQAILIFAFQNDRGKDLTNLEKLKAFLMHQVYIHSPSHQLNEAIESVEREFTDIYKVTEHILLDEDQVLGFHLTAFLAQEDDAVNLIKKALRLKAIGIDKVDWIRNFCRGLRISFDNVHEIEHYQYGGNQYEQLIGDVLQLNAKASWPLLLKMMHYHHENLSSLEKSLRFMEITLFKLQFMSGTSTNSLPKFATLYDGKLENLLTLLRYSAQHGFQGYWDFNGRLKEFLEGNHHYRRETKYLLWKYENEKRQQVGFLPRLSLKEYESDVPGHSLDTTIEHIMPINPDGLIHSEDFEQNYLHNLGNLVLMTRGGNSSASNALPLKKATRFETSNLLTHKEVANVIFKQGGWGEKEISARKQQIVDFALRHWQVGTEI